MPRILPAPSARAHPMSLSRATSDGTHTPRDGRVVTRDHFSAMDALRIFPEPERVDGSEVTAERAAHVGWGFASSLVTPALTCQTTKGADATVRPSIFVYGGP